MVLLSFALLYFLTSKDVMYSLSVACREFGIDYTGVL